MTTDEHGLMCPNCGLPAAGAEAGTKIVCATCGGTFQYVAGEAKLAGTGLIDKLQADIDEIKARLPASQPAAAVPDGDDDDAGTEPGTDDDEDEL